MQKKLLSFLLSLSVIAGCIPANIVHAENNKRERTAYIHAQGAKPAETTDVSTVYTDQVTDIYFAVDNPNMGRYENGEHKEPQYDMNGYNVTIYFDPDYFSLIGDTNKPIDFSIPDNTPDLNTGDLEVRGYREHEHKVLNPVNINGKSYTAVWLTVFFQGFYVPQKPDGALWYNLCKLPLQPKRTGSTQVFFDTGGQEDQSLVLFAKNNSDDLSEQTFEYTAINGGYHTIVIKDKTRPAAPTATPNEGSYTEAQQITLSAENDCDIYWSKDGVSFEKYIAPIVVDITTTITCYAQRRSDDKKSNTVKFTYNILPKAPFMFVDNGSEKELIRNIYNENDKFTVYVADKADFGPIDDGSEIFYTFSNISEENITPGSNPETEWVLLDKMTQSIEITKRTTVRLITKKLEEFSAVSEYHLGIKPAMPVANKPSGEYDKKIDIKLSTVTSDADIYYTLDGSNPITNGTLYDGVITVAKDTTLRAVAEFDGIYSELA